MSFLERKSQFHISSTVRDLSRAMVLELVLDIKVAFDLAERCNSILWENR